MNDLTAKHNSAAGTFQVIDNKARLKKLNGIQFSDGSIMGELGESKNSTVNPDSIVKDSDFILFAQSITEQFPDLSGYLKAKGAMFIVPADRDIETPPMDIIPYDVGEWRAGEALAENPYREKLMQAVYGFVKFYVDWAPSTYRLTELSNKSLSEYLRQPITAQKTLQQVLENPEKHNKNGEAFTAICQKIHADFPSLYAKILTSDVGVSASTMARYVSGVSAPHLMLQNNLLEKFLKGLGSLRPEDCPSVTPQAKTAPVTP